MEGGTNHQNQDSSDNSVSDSDFFGSTDDRSYSYSFFHPRGTLHRFIALFFMCWLSFGSYFCYDNPAALQEHFTHDLNITYTQFSMFYSLYSWPTVVVCFVGGVLIDTVFGIRFGANLYMGITLIGQILFALGALVNMFWLMALGRFFFGIGAEPLAVAQNNYAVLWFKGKELNMVFGLQLSFARVGSAVNFWVMEPLYEWVNHSYTGHECLGIVLFMACLTCVASMICAGILGCIDKRAERILERDAGSREIVKLSDIKYFPFNFWLVSIVCVTYYIAIFPFVAFGKSFFMQRFHMSGDSANKVNSMIYLISAVASPILGFLVDRTGRNVFWVITAISMTIGAHSVLAFTTWNPYYGMTFMGVAYSVLASGLWPLVALLIPEHQLGTAYGICQSIQNLGLAVASIVAGTVVDHLGYEKLEWFFIGTLSVSLFLSVLVWIVDFTRNGTLNMSPSQREFQHQNMLAAEALEREKLLSAGVSSSVTPHDLLQPNSDFHIRNRYLSRIGAPVHLMPTSIH